MTVNRTKLGRVLLVSLLLSVAGTELSAQAPEAGEPLVVKADRGYLGYGSRYETISETHGGIRIVGIAPGGPGEKAGLMKGDLIVEINGEPIFFENDLEMARGMGRVKVGDRPELEVKRGETYKVIDVLAERYPPEVLLRLSRWMEVAADRLREGKGIHGDEEKADRGPGESRRLSAFLRRASGDDVELVIEKNSSGAVALSADKEEVLPKGFNSSDLPALSRKLAEALRPGDSFKLLVSFSEATKMWDLQFVDVPEYLDVTDYMNDE